MIWLLHVIPTEAYVSIECRSSGSQKEKAFLDAEAVLNRVAVQLKDTVCTYEVRRWYPVNETKHSFASIGSIA